MQGRSDEGKICCKRRIHAPKKPTAVRSDFDFTQSYSLLTATGIIECSAFLINLRRIVKMIDCDQFVSTRSCAPEILHRDIDVGTSRALIPEAVRASPNIDMAILFLFLVGRSQVRTKHVT